MDTKPHTLISRDELVELLRSKCSGAVMVSLLVATDPLSSGMRKTGNPYVRGSGPAAHSVLRRVGKANGILNSQYSASVERRLSKNINETRADNGLPPLEGDALQAEINSLFRRGESWWCPIVAENGNVTPLAANKKTPDRPEYISFVVRANGDGELIGVEDGNAVAYSEIESFMPAKRNYDNQGLPEEDKVRIQCYKLSNIIQIILNGEIMIVSDNVEQYNPATRRTLLKIGSEYANGEREMHKAGIQ